MVKINEKYYIDADTNNYTLKEKTIVTSKNGEKSDGYKDLGYYTTLDSLFNGIVKYETRKFISETEDSTIKELLNKINEIETFLKEQFKGV